MQRRLQPLAGSYFALVAEAVTVGPSPALHEQFDSLFNLPLIRIALLDYRDWNAMRAENDLRPFRVGESCQCFVYLFDQRPQVKFVTIEGLDAVDCDVVLKQSPPLVQAAARRRAGIVRIKRKQYNLVASCVPKLFDGLRGKRMPITHGD